jgi:hypothetical protein
MKYLCLAYEEERTLSELSQTEWRALRQETLDYVAALRERGHLIDARPLRSATAASMIRVRSGALSVTDGPFAETKEQLGGYFLLQVDSREEAVRIASRWPSARFGSIEVRPVDEDLNPDRRY